MYVVLFFQCRGVRDEKAIEFCRKLLSVNLAVRPTADSAADDDFFWSMDEGGDFFNSTSDPAELPQLVSFRSGVDTTELHECSVKRR